MKIAINNLKEIPKEFSNDFGLCVYGTPDNQVSSWIEFHGFKTEKSGPCTNIYIDKDLSSIFISPKKYEYLDGFSPNLNKHLHIGHLSNLVLAKSFKALGVADKTIAILGEALEAFKKYCLNFDYKVDKIFMASDMKFEDDILQDGSDEYAGTKCFNINGEKIVGIKSDGTTSYFYQDVALATMLNSSTLYLTGNEQNAHFKNLKAIFPMIDHVGLGLLKINRGKMSSRIGNIITASDLLNFMMDMFDGNTKVVYNVFAGYILKSVPKTDKNIDMNLLSNPLNSQGLYLSYTLAKLKSAGVVIETVDNFKSQELQFSMLKSQTLLSPNILFNSLVDLAKKISGLYVTHKIKDNKDNNEMFKILGSDLSFGMKKLGLFEVDNV